MAGLIDIIGLCLCVGWVWYNKYELNKNMRRFENLKCIAESEKEVINMLIEKYPELEEQSGIATRIFREKMLELLDSKLSEIKNLHKWYMVWGGLLFLIVANNFILKFILDIFYNTPY